MSRRAITAALVLSFALAGCGSSGDKPDNERVGSPASATSAAKDSAPALPKGYTWQTIDEASLKFAVPDSWTAINPKKVMASGDTSVFDEMAKKMGVTSKQMQAAVGNADLMILAPAKDGYADNVSGLMVPLTELPTEAQLQAEIGRLSEEKVTITNEASPAGPTVTANYVLTLAAKKIQGRSMFVKGKDGVLNLTISALDADGAQKVADTIRSTIHKV